LHVSAGVSHVGPFVGGVMSTLTIEQHASARTERRTLVRHFLEMVAAMIVGMAVLGGVVRMIFWASGHSDLWVDHVGLRAPVMAVNMTVGMSAWMRYRGHRWDAIAEMAAAMLLPFVVLIGPFLAGVVSGGALLGWMHVLMLPAMAVAMRRRRDEYSRDHRVHASAAPAA
jgi:uncharacterized Tic20 family protein